MKLALLGYGKMGKEIEKIALERGHEIVLKISGSNLDQLSVENLRQADVAIEFSKPENAVNNIHTCFEANVPVVVGTTGWLEKYDEIKKICVEKKKALFFASNFSIGVNLFFKLNEALARLTNPYPEYKVSIEEIHHVHKLDAPSGTAITLANGIIKNNDRKSKWVNVASDKKEELSILSKRIDEVPGTHSIEYDSEIDRISIIHEAKNRKGFAQGAVIAAEWINGKTGIFGMDDLLSIK